MTSREAEGVARGRQQTEVNCWLAPQKVLEGLMLSWGESPDAPGWDYGYLSSCLHCLIPPPLGLTDEQHSFAHRGQVFSSKAKSWICLVNLDAPLFTPHCQNHCLQRLSWDETGGWDKRPPVSSTVASWATYSSKSKPLVLRLPARTAHRQGRPCGWKSERLNSSLSAASDSLRLAS